MPCQLLRASDLVYSPHEPEAAQVLACGAWHRFGSGAEMTTHDLKGSGGNPGRPVQISA